jgi:hypothetical protein
VITISTARTEVPWVTFAIGRKGREPDRPLSWIQWRQLDDVITALQELKEHEVGLQAAGVAERHTEAMERRSGAYRGGRRY